MQKIIKKQIVEKKPRHLSLADDMRKELATLNVGQMLSPERELAKQYSTSHTTIRKVLSVLEDEGFLHTYHGRGRVVTDPLLQGEFAIVMLAQLMGANFSLFYRETAMFLSERIQKYSDADWSSRLHLGERAEDFPATLNLLEPDVIKKLRGVFTFHSLGERITKALEQRRIPVVQMGEETRYANVSVTHQRDSLFRESLRYLRDVGCKTVGLLLGWYQGDENLSKPKEELFAKYAIEAGLSTQEKWIHRDLLGNSAERYGYECFMKLWERGDCPDAFIINDDIVACGVFRAVLHKQIRVPEEVRLITYANKGVDLHYHLPVTRYEFDMREIADAAFDAMVKLLNGQELEHNVVYVPGKLLKGQTA